VAALHQARNDSKSELAAREKALELSPGDIQAMRLLADGLGRAGELERARAMLEEALRTHPRDAGTLYLMALSHWKAKEKDPAIACVAGGQTWNTVWYVFTASADGMLTFDTCGSTYDTVVSVFGGSCASPTSIACNDDVGPNDVACGATQSRVSIDVAAGQTYRIEVGAPTVPGGGALTVHASLAPRDCLNGGCLPGGGGGVRTQCMSEFLIEPALQTGIVDGQENGLVAIESGKLYEVQKFVSQTNHIWDPFWLLGNRRAFGALPDNLKEIVRREFDRASMEQRADVEKLNASLKDQLVAKGLSFETPDRAGFRTALSKAGFYKEWKDKFGAENWAVLESITGPLS
jgi:hypothetical protein